jgi:hypothetical protein
LHFAKAVVVDAKDRRRQFRAADVKSQNVLRVRHVSKAQQAPTDLPSPVRGES